MILVSLHDAMGVLEAAKFADEAERRYAFSLMERLPEEGQTLGYSDGFADGYKQGKEDALGETVPPFEVEEGGSADETD